MHLVLDLGNTRAKFGLFEADHLLHHWTLETLHHVDRSYFEISLQNRLLELDIAPGNIEMSTLSSVVPALSEPITEVLQMVLGRSPHLVTYGDYPHVTSLTDNPYELGTDLYSNAIAAQKLHHGATIVVDLGTALTFLALRQGQILGVSIAPGIGTALKSLFRETAQLPDVPIAKPRSALGLNTVDAITSGVIGGYIAMIKAQIEAIQAEFEGEFRVVGTGGFSNELEDLEMHFDLIDPFFTLRGINLFGLYRQNLVDIGAEHTH